MSGRGDNGKQEISGFFLATREEKPVPSKPAFTTRSNGDLTINRDLTVREVREAFKISQQSVYELIKAGTVRAYKVGRLTRLRKEDLNAMRDTSFNTGTNAQTAA